MPRFWLLYLLTNAYIQLIPSRTVEIFDLARP